MVPILISQYVSKLLLIVTHKGATAAAASDAGKSKRDQTRANLESGARMAATGLIGGDFTVTPNPPYREHRNDVFEALFTAQEARTNSLPETAITIVLPSGEEKQGVAFRTTPYDVAKEISQGLADSVVIARVEYTVRLEGSDEIVACDEEEGAEAAADALTQSAGELWDLNRPLVGSCKMTLLKFDEPEAKTVSHYS